MKSDAQLDAEAEGRKVALSDLITFHRKLFHADLYIPKLTTETPPVTTDPDTGEQRADPMSMLGPTLSYQLSQYLHASSMFPWSRGYASMRTYCRRNHNRGHLERPEWNGSLCGALVSYVVRREYHFDRACFELYLSPKRAEATLRSALRLIEATMDDLAAEPVSYGGAWPREPTHVHRPVGGLHAVECHHPDCASKRRVA